MENNKKPEKSRQKTPKKITPTYLENAGLYYLERYASSAENFRKIMMRKIKNSCKFHNTEVGEFVPMLDKLIERYKSVGLLNDEVFARSKVASLRRKGMGRQGIVAKLQAKGLSQEQIKSALKEIDEDKEDAELEAAREYVRRKKLGMHRTKTPDDLKKHTQKELASLARAGFSYEVARKALEFDEEDL